MTMIHYIQIHEGPKEAQHTMHPGDWKEWHGAADRYEVENLALNKWVRERGGIQPGEEVTLHIYEHDAGFTKCHPNGAPFRVNHTTLVLKK